ncbi:hypothetical protein I79_009947 [Cricetulus griseus]|uniref:Uncharacterized protein n=1 Tax=Cricetulus griseus TaxID=10029 RepID=G3HH50_CRIGR|nr:hypothetical protein I79_009947 [Cricetulus griseus]
MRPKKDPPPAGQTPNPAALCPASGAHDGIPWASKGFGNPSSSSAIHSTQSFCLGLAPLHACSFPLVMPHSSGTSTILRSTLKLRLHIHIFT